MNRTLWHWRLGPRRGTVAANTKSEARAQLRRALKLPKRLHLPSSVITRREPA